LYRKIIASDNKKKLDFKAITSFANVGADGASSYLGDPVVITSNIKTYYYKTNTYFVKLDD